MDQWKDGTSVTMTSRRIDVPGTLHRLVVRRVTVLLEPTASRTLLIDRQWVPTVWAVLLAFALGIVCGMWVLFVL